MQQQSLLPDTWKGNDVTATAYDSYPQPMATHDLDIEDILGEYSSSDSEHSHPSDCFYEHPNRSLSNPNNTFTTQSCQSSIPYVNKTNQSNHSNQKNCDDSSKLDTLLDSSVTHSRPEDEVRLTESVSRGVSCGNVFMNYQKEPSQLHNQITNSPSKRHVQQG